MPIKEQQLASLALINAYLIFLWLIICKYGGLHLASNISNFLDFYTLVILLLVLSPALFYSLKWIWSKKWQDKKLILVGTFFLLGFLFLYY